MASRRAARKPDVRSGIGRSARYDANPLSAALPSRRRIPACVARDRAPTTRSYSPSLLTRRTASEGCVLAVAVDDQDVVAGGRANPGLHRRRRCPCCRDAVMTRAPARRGFRRGPIRRAVVDDEDLVPVGRRRAVRRTTPAMAPASFMAGMTTETDAGAAIGASVLPLACRGRGSRSQFHRRTRYSRSSSSLRAPEMTSATRPMSITWNPTIISTADRISD